MNLHHLELFLAVAEEGSITRGSERAVISQPAVSRAIAELERAVGDRLLDRGPKGVVPTAAGQTLLSYARQIFRLELEATEALADLRGLEAGRLTIGASTTIGDHLLPGVIARFLQDYPAIRLSMEVANTEVVQSGVLEGKFDVGFTEGHVDVDRFAVTPFYQDQLVVFCAPSHPLSQVAEASIQMLSDFGFIMREEGSGTRRVVEAHFANAGLVPKISCTLGSTSAIKFAVAAGLGLGVVSVLALTQELARNELILIDSPISLSRQLHTIRLPWRSESATLRRFLHLLEAFVKA